MDSLGRGSSVSTLLADAGGQPVPENTLDAKVTYTSRWYQVPDVGGRPPTWWGKHLVLTPTGDRGAHPDEHEYLSNFFPIEGGRAIACMGSWGLDMARRPEAFEAFEASAERLRTPVFARAMAAGTPLSQVHVTRATGNMRRRYDLLDHPPLGLVSAGDTICAFNPFCAQGMSSGARSALALGEALADHR